MVNQMYDKAMMVLFLASIQFIVIFVVYSIYVVNECKLAYSTSERPVSEIIEVCK